MRVLVACEFSGVVREAFRRRGHDAWSCDLLPAEDGSEFHFECDVRVPLGMHHGISHPNPYRWDLLIGHPPCTYLANSGAKHLYVGMKKVNGRCPIRWAKMEEAARFYNMLLSAPIPMKVIENPIMHCHARELCGGVRPQYIQPYQFGHGETKATGLRLVGLPRLRPTNIVEGRTARVHKMPPGPDRWKERSRTLPGIAEAMADQWGKHQAQLAA